MKTGKHQSGMLLLWFWRGHVTLSLHIHSKQDGVSSGTRGERRVVFPF